MGTYYSGTGAGNTAVNKRKEIQSLVELLSQWRKAEDK